MLSKRIKLRKNLLTLPIDQIDPNTTHLEIISEGLEKIPKELSRLSEIRSLSFYCPNLVEFPDWVFRFKLLQTLKLKNTPLIQLPKVVPECPFLFLQLSGCSLTQIPKWIGEKKLLRELDLSKNKLESLPTEMGELKALARLNLDCNQLVTIPSSLDNLSALNHLSLDQNPLEESEKSRLQNIFGIWF